MLGKIKTYLGFFIPGIYRPLKVGFGTLIDAHSQIGHLVKIGRYCRIYQSQIAPHVQVYGECRLEQVTIGSFSFLNGPMHLMKVEMGRFCSIGPHCGAGFGDHPSNWVSTNPAFYSTRAQCGMTFADSDYFEEMNPIVLGHDVWVGANVYLRGGVKVGHGSVIAAGAIVTKDVPPYCIVGGVPARAIRFRFSPQDIDNLLALQWWNWGVDDLRRAAPLFRKDSPRELVEWSREQGILG